MTLKTTYRRIIAPIRLLLLCLMSSSLCLLNAIETKDIELKTGISALLYQHIYSFQSSLAWEASAAMPFRGNLYAQAGLRLGLDPILPEGYLRLGSQPRFKLWKPEAGIELGLSNRARFKHEKLLLSEMQQATDSDISPLYLSFYASPLSFVIKDKYLLSLSDIQVGSHLSHLGRTARVQLSVINFGVKL